MPYKDPEKRREYIRKYNAEHREQVREYQRKHDAKRREQKREYDRKYAAEHREQRREYDRKYYAEHKKQKREYRAGRKEQQREYMREYRKNPDVQYKIISRQIANDYYKYHSEERHTSCDLCGAEGTLQMHHTDYTEPLNVMWLCIECHRKEHRHGEDQVQEQ